ncbi:carbohydrate kinase family protein [Candidatus Thorarchaeota archaeon]|nr:MAG: carbohydrate kinase family protein [Candidatus Thorarchaeota archaeon]
MEIIVVGHLSRDLIITPDYEREALGGAAAYAMVAPHLGALGAGIVSRVGEDFEQTYIDDLREANLDLTGLRVSGEKTTRFVNKYDRDGNRTQYVEAIAPELRAADLSPEHLEANIFHFSPIIGEVHPSCIEAAKTYGALISLDVQGYVRENDEGKVVPKEWTDADQIIRNVDILKCDKEEMKLFADDYTEEDSAEKILSWGPHAIIVTKNQEGSTIYTRNIQTDIPSVVPEDYVDSTGCGDTYAIAFLLEYMRTGDVKRAGLFGATTSSFNLEHVGPYSLPSRSEIEDRMKQYMEA